MGGTLEGLSCSGGQRVETRRIIRSEDGMVSPEGVGRARRMRRIIQNVTCVQTKKV